jgi:proline dehydrogenase
MLSFENTAIAFTGKSNEDLKRAHIMFRLVKNQSLVRTGSIFLNLANAMNFPLGWALKKNVFQHFCGGETLEECQPTISQLGHLNIKTILDYAAEGSESDKAFDEAKERILATINLAKTDHNIGFAVFKFTGIARFELLEKLSSQSPLSKSEQEEFERVKKRAREICQFGYQNAVSVMIDAEESWIQDAIDDFVEELILTYNRSAPIVYHTIQLYRIDKLFYLKELVTKLKKEKCIPGFKLVRGAYMEKERKRADKLGYSSPIHPDKDSTDAAFNDALKFCINNIEYLSVCVGSHNEESNKEAVHLMHINDLGSNHARIHFSQLMGMSDHISNNLAINGYNVSKYVPYGPFKLALPYLLRRAQENTSVAGQTSRELSLIRMELKRRARKS